MRYEVRALKGHEGIVSVAIDATDEASAIEQARTQGLAVLSARPSRAWPTLARSFDRGFPLVLFSQELVALLDAGLSLPETLETMVEKEGRSETRAVLTQVRDKLFEGRSFSQALEAFPQVFPALYTATVRASERTGDLSEYACQAARVCRNGGAQLLFVECGCETDRCHDSRAGEDTRSVHRREAQSRGDERHAGSGSVTLADCSAPIMINRARRKSFCSSPRALCAI